MYSRLLFIFFVFLLCSCKKEKTTTTGRDDSEIRSRYFQLEKIGWKSREYSQKVDDISFTATEVPIQYYILKDQGKTDLFKVDSLYEANKQERVIEFTFRQDDEKDLLGDQFTGLPYEDAVKYMAFALDKDFYVVTSKNDTIACNGVSYERNYKIAPFQKVVLFFSGIDPNEKIQLVYKDHLFRKGTLKFKFKDTFTEILL
ncbi:hypothetical protein [Flavobacterium cerinum]|uniref:DUF4738 domain-containing protein n=1 Tax=Flavobacterium cerinum TaxID=2502784 RepID=A0ABY5IUI7_9FLAO|nr:hypothetical protein [Flavobacterium cerinum]UUC46478.1 hypothetical protein NOX80_04565 [Flavobacterium cerinum]